MSKASRIPRVISVLLALSLLLSLLPGALAAEPQLTRADLAVMVYNKFLPTATGEAPNFTDLTSCSEEQKTAINTLAAAGKQVISVGKIRDIFAGRGITQGVTITGNTDGMEKTLQYAHCNIHHHGSG